MSGWLGRLTKGMAVSVGELAHELIDVLQRQRVHLIMREIADRMWQFDHGMAFHTPALELMYCRVFEYLREHHRCGDAAFLELHRVVHTAQRA